MLFIEKTLNRFLMGRQWQKGVRRKKKPQTKLKRKYLTALMTFKTFSPLKSYNKWYSFTFSQTANLIFL